MQKANGAVPVEAFLALSEASGACVAILDDRGVVGFANRRCRSELGLDDESGQSWTDIWGREHAAEVERALASARAGVPARLRALKEVPGEAPQWWDTAIEPVRKDDAVIALVASSRNVTAEIEAQSILDSIIDHVPAVLFAKEASDGRIKLLNRAAEEFFGRPKEEMLGRTTVELFDPETATAMLAADAEIARTGRMATAEQKVVTETGEERTFKVRVMATFGDEGARHLIGVAQDVTDERAAAEAMRAAAERADAANRSKSEFLANMSHEIRTPLNGVVAVADVLARTELSASQHDMVEIIRSSGVTLERLLSDVLDLARIESGAIEMQDEPMHLGDAVRGVATLLGMRAEEKGVALEAEVGEGAEAWVLSDGVRLKQILTNLTSNAIKFTDKGEVRVEARRVEGLDGQPWFELKVRDTGVGFDPSRKDKVFGRFQQADGSITRRFGGTGLGLAISRQLAELMGGVLDCDSEPGVGSTFWVRLPLRLTDAPTAGAGDGGDGPDLVQDGRGLRILSADDHPINRKVVELILLPLGVELVSVEDGRQAIEAYAASGFDVVLMDMQMPIMDGLSATREIRRLEQATGRPPARIFMLSANALAEHLELSRAAGADRHLSKPISAVSLIKAICEADEAVPRTQVSAIGV